MTRGSNMGARYLLGEHITRAGRHPESDIFLDDITVSRRHVEITHIDGGTFVIHDVGSLNGTYVNRERIDEATLLPATRCRSESSSCSTWWRGTSEQPHVSLHRGRPHAPT